jgi:hypothetical protein
MTDLRTFASHVRFIGVCCVFGSDFFVWSIKDRVSKFKRKQAHDLAAGLYFYFWNEYLIVYFTVLDWSMSVLGCMRGMRMCWFGRKEQRDRHATALRQL